ncbi:hypothetical protein [uncultured Desulfovibrio sp.]|uniref:hypothetical protein n=1 Tax=uncultured Desulfovibrio sp. TaxID=167968 RepID=UPI002671309D|nr:hypothetical protein [uncultured Desulfovibrio sp.]
MGIFRSATSRFSRFVMGVYCFFYHIVSRAAGIAVGCVGGACLLFYLYTPLMAPLDAASHLPDWNPARAQLITISSLSGVVTAQPVLDSKDNRWKLIPNGPVFGNFKVESFVNPIADRKVSDSRTSRGKAVEDLRESASKPRAAFTMATFEKLLKVPAKKLHPELKDQGGPVLVVFTWEDCPTCTALQIYFDKHKEKYPFQILFAPIAGNALRYLDKQTAPKNEQKELLAGVSVTSQILADHTGALRVPAFAWRVENRDLPSGAEVGCATLSGQELDHLLARMAAAVGQGSSK